MIDITTKPNYKIINSDELKNYQLKAVEALEILKQICDSNGIRFFLLAGTALGAVREKAIIPWDDDIDVGFLYDDLELLKDILPKELPEGFQYVDFDIEEKFPRLHGKILYNRRNVVDIFCLVKWRNSLSGKIHWFYRDCFGKCYLKMIGYEAPHNSLCKRKKSVNTIVRDAMIEWFYTFSSHFCTFKTYKKLIKWNEKHFESRKFDCYINLYSIYGRRKETILKKWVEINSIVEFEGQSYYVFGDTDAYLTQLYGDYMIPPSKDFQIASHQETF